MHPAARARTLTKSTHMPSFNPLLSIVIPTHKRKHLLVRAIKTAIRSSPDNDIEVIVVPNGNDDSWKTTASIFKNDKRIKWHPIPTANANSARNHGKNISKGKYIRFLDDDDTLSADGSQYQLSMIKSSGAEICSGTVTLVDRDGNRKKLLGHADTSDFCVAMISDDRLCLPTSHLFLRSSIKDHSWNESLSVEQDTDWMIQLATKREWNWLPIERNVGEWMEHDGPRTSKSISNHARNKLVATILKIGADHLRKRGALGERRRIAYAQSLWSLAHTSFKHAPIYWSRVAKLAMSQQPESRPPDPFFRLPIIRNTNPIMIEWLMLPKRWANELKRDKE